MSLSRLITLWTRPGWLLFFIIMFAAIFFLFLIMSHLDAILVSHSDMSDEPILEALTPNAGFFRRAKYKWDRWNKELREQLAEKNARKNDKELAWILGVGWSFTGGLLAGGCLVFAKAWYVIL